MLLDAPSLIDECAPDAPPEIPASELLPVAKLAPSAFSVAVYGDPDAEADGLLDSIAERGILVPLVIAPATGGMRPGRFEVISGHRRLACAKRLGWELVPCVIRDLPPGDARRQGVLDYNRQRRKSFSQTMREADALEELLAPQARRRRLENLIPGRGEPDPPERRNSDNRTNRTDATIAARLGLGGKDTYRQARAVWGASRGGDPRAVSAVAQLDAGTKSIHAAHKDLRRRDRFTTGFKPTPYDVWPFRHDPAYGIPHPGSIPAAIVAHALHYFADPDDLIVDPMAGGGVTLDVCQAMGRRCLAYDVAPTRSDVRQRDVTSGFSAEAAGAGLIFCDPPYHTMMAGRYEAPGVGDAPLAGWTDFLGRFARDAFATLRPGGHVALLVANQTEKDLPPGHGYIDHAMLAYAALVAAGFWPQRRISCPMSGAYLPQQVIAARREGRMLGQVRDLLVMRKPPGAGNQPSTGPSSPPASS